MKKRIFIIILVMAIIVSGCSKKEIINMNLKTSDQTYLLGTLVKVTIYGKEVSDQKFDEVFRIISSIEEKVSKNIVTSEVSKINSNMYDEVQLSRDTFNIINKGLYYSKLSGGKFDITIAPLVDLWGIGSEGSKVPNEEEISEALKLIDYSQIELNEDNLSVNMPKEMEIDLGGIAKGYVADQVSEFLRKNDLGHAIINLGGNILTVGNKPNGDSWKIGIQNPFDTRGKELGIATLGQKSVVTSGIYERYLEQDGIKYHHILDPFTGFPVENDLASVTILSDYSVDGDGLSTVIFSMGLGEGYDFIENMDNVDAIFVTKDKNVYITSGAKKIFQLTNFNYKIKELVR